MDAERKESLKNAETIVIKVGTNVLTRADGTLEPNQVHSLADQIFRLKQAGKKVALVSSGAIGAGMGRLLAEQGGSGSKRKPSHAPEGGH